jgi:hypothetical protein
MRFTLFHPVYREMIKPLERHITEVVGNEKKESEIMSPVLWSILA